MCVFDTHPLVLFRSSPHSQRRLSDLMVGLDVGEMGLGLEGHLDDMIAPEFEDIEGIPQQETALDRRLEATGDLVSHAIDAKERKMHASMSHSAVQQRDRNPYAVKHCYGSLVPRSIMGLHLSLYACLTPQILCLGL